MRLIVAAADRMARLLPRHETQVDPGEDLTPGDSKISADLVTTYNLYGFVDGLVKSPAGWAFGSEEFGRTPSLNGYPMVLPVDAPNTSNFTWTVTKPVAADARNDGFSAPPRVSAIVEGGYSAQATRQAPSVQGQSATPGAAASTSKQAMIGAVATPNFFAGVK